MVFNENTAGYGGAASIISNDGFLWPVLTMYINYTLYFIRNHADTTGGALHIDDSGGCYLLPRCFFSFATPSHNYSIENASLVFINNSAGWEGSVLYGAELNKCLVYSGNDSNCNTCGKQIGNKNTMETFMNRSHITSEGNVSIISSLSDQVCFCNEHHDIVQNCSKGIAMTVELFPGQLFNIIIVGLGQGNHPGPLIILTQITDDSLILSPEVQLINSTCTTLYYRAYF